MFHNQYKEIIYKLFSFYWLNSVIFTLIKYVEHSLIFSYDAQYAETIRIGQVVNGNKHKVNK